MTFQRGVKGSSSGPAKRKREVEPNARNGKSHEPLDIQLLRDKQVLPKRHSLALEPKNRTPKKASSVIRMGIIENDENKHPSLNENAQYTSDNDSDDEEHQKDIQGFALTERETKRILEEAKLQQEEIEAEENAVLATKQSSLWRLKRESVKTVESEEENDEDRNAIAELDYNDDEEEEQGENDLRHVSVKDRELFEKWNMPLLQQGMCSVETSKSAPFGSFTLSDMIMKKLKEKLMSEEPEEEEEEEEEDSMNMEDGRSVNTKKKRKMEARASDQSEPESISSLPPKVVDVYKKVGTLLSRYKSGKLPKAFKILPALKNWQLLLQLTEPEKWTPHAVYQATRVFSSSLKPYFAQRYYAAVLLSHVRHDIQTNKKLNAYLYQALKKALYKPAAFFKGILLPLAEARDCTLKEAVIIASVMCKTSVPVLHTSAALLQLAQLRYTGAISIFIKGLLDKRYTLPYKVIDGLVQHFVSFAALPDELYVLWHQSLLVFVQRYKLDLSEEQRKQIIELIKIKSHHLITPEIRRELYYAMQQQSVGEAVHTRPADMQLSH